VEKVKRRRNDFVTARKKEQHGYFTATPTVSEPAKKPISRVALL